MNCRSCGGTLAAVCNLGTQPLANALLNSPQDTYDLYPLELLICESCQLGQLKDFAPPEAMFREYVYYTSIARPSVEAAGKLVGRIIHEAESINTVVEIGSNDGYLLRFYHDVGIHVLGIDPANGPANVAIARGVPTVKEFFTLKLARELPKADIIHANNVLAHVPDLNDFVDGLAELLTPQGTIYIEVPYFADLLEKCAFDTIYHEHSYYFSIKSLDALFLRHGLFIRNIEKLDAHGGSLRLTITKNFCTLPFIENLVPDCREMQPRMDALARELRETLVKFRDDKKHVWGFGAAAKATVMMNYCGIDSTMVERIADETPAKVGKFIPGTGVSILYTRDWLAAKPEYTCIFAWNYAAKVAQQYARHYPGIFFTPHLLQTLSSSFAEYKGAR